MSTERVRAWDARTGEPLPGPVPRTWFDLYPHLTDKEPTKKASAKAQTTEEKK